MSPIEDRQSTMLGALGTLVQEVGMATDLDQVLEIVVGGVRSAMQVDACTVLLLEDGGYVLRATDGLDPDAAGHVRIPRGRGLIGLVGEGREPLALADQQAHASFLRVPVVGEESMHGFLGVPIVHYGRLIGVLTVQRTDAVGFEEADEAFLLTAAAQVAGAIQAASREQQLDTDVLARGRTTVLQGAPAAPGAAVGSLVTAAPYSDLGAVPDEGSTDPEQEERALCRAVREVEAAIRAQGAEMATLLPAEANAVFEAHALIAGDEQLLGRALERIRAGQWAPAALRDTVDELAGEMAAASDEYLRARAEDVRAVGRQILLRLQPRAAADRVFAGRTVLIGEEVGLDRLAEIPRENLAAVVCLGSSAASHMAIVARGLGVPAVTGIGPLPLADLDGRPVAVDGYRGQVVLEPSRGMRRAMRRLERDRRTLSVELDGLRERPATTPDGAELPLYLNVGLLGDHSSYHQAGASGVGLYRTELEFGLRAGFPSEDEQYRAYRDLLAEFAPGPVTIRTLDIGGDKDLPYFPIDGEENPVLGWRGLRVSLHHPEIFLPQLRALLRAQADIGNLRVLLPIVTGADELADARDLLARAARSLRRSGNPAKVPPLGAMVEVPAALHQIPEFASVVDFLAIGTNDLTQYLLAVDRNNARVAIMYDHLHPAVIRALHGAVRAAHRQRLPIGVCGEMAGQPEAALLLLGMGVDYLSMAASRVPLIKWMVRNVTRADARELLARALRLPRAAETRALLREALEQRGLGALVQH